MINSTGRAISAYVRTGVETAVPEADPHRLISMLFEGALAAIADARLKLGRGDIAGRGKAISKAISIVQDGLRASLDHEKGGELAANLGALYEYSTRRLLEANLRGSPEPLEEVSKLLSGLQSAWEAIGPSKHAANNAARA